MWNCLKHDYFGHSSCNQENWAIWCSLGWGHRHPQQLVWECPAWSNTKEEAARLKLFVILERACQLFCAQPCLPAAAAENKDPRGIHDAQAGRWEVKGRALLLPSVTSLQKPGPWGARQSWQPQEQKLLQMLWTTQAWLRVVSPSYRKRSPTSPISYSPHNKAGDHKCFWEEQMLLRENSNIPSHRGGAAQFTLLMSEMSFPSLGMYTFWLLALILLWMVKSSTSRFPFSVNLNKILQENWVIIKLSLLLRNNHRIMDWQNGLCWKEH